MSDRDEMAVGRREFLQAHLVPERPAEVVEPGVASLVGKANPLALDVEDRLDLEADAAQLLDLVP